MYVFSIDSAIQCSKTVIEILIPLRCCRSTNYNSHASIMLRLNVCDCRSSSNVKDFTNLNLKAYVLPRHFSSVVKTQKINVTFFFKKKITFRWEWSHIHYIFDTLSLSVSTAEPCSLWNWVTVWLLYCFRDIFLLGTDESMWHLFPYEE